jgi:hypothetical protein
MCIGWVSIRFLLGDKSFQEFLDVAEQGRVILSQDKDARGVGRENMDDAVLDF